MRIEPRRVAAEASRAEELPIRGGRRPTAEQRREGLALLLIDHTAMSLAASSTRTSPIATPRSTPR